MKIRLKTDLTMRSTTMTDDGPWPEDSRVLLGAPYPATAFNTNGIVFDNSPWRPGREMDLVDKPINEEDDRKLKNLATRIMSNGVEVLVKDKSSDGKNDQTKYMEVKTIQPSTPTNMYVSNFPKIDKRIDSHEEDNFDMLQPSELGYVPCTTSCSCSHAKTEGLKTKYTQVDASISAASKYGIKTSKYGNSKIDLRPTNKESLEKKTKYGPYEFETSSHIAPTDRIVEKYTEVINDYSDEKDPSSVEDSELLTNEQAPTPTKINKISNKNPEKNKPEKITKPNKNKFVVADLLKLGSLGIKGLSQLAPVIEKMTGGFIKRQENKTLTTTTIKPVEKLTAYNVDKRVDADIDFKQSSFPIYIPVDEMETSESQTIFTNATLHQNLAWAAEHKQPKAHIVRPKIVHESPLVNGGIPISPGEIITANSDVIVGKPAVGGPLTLAASGIKLHNPVNPPPIDSFIAANEEYVAEEKPPNDQFILTTKVDDSYDLRPPDLPKPKPKPLSRPHSHQHINSPNNMPNRMPPSMSHSTDNIMKTEHIKTGNVILGNHGRPVFLDYIPSLAKPGNNLPPKQHVASLPIKDENNDQEIVDNSPSSSEIVNTHVRTNGEYAITGNIDSAKPFLVDIQPSRVANVLIPHGSSTALVFAGSSEPHKTGDYVDDPLPYPEPGYFGSFSIDAPQMTNVHNVAPTNNKQFAANAHIYPSAVLHTPTIPLPHKDQPFRNDLKSKWKDFKRPVDFNKIPPPTSNQETHVHFGSQITSYDPDIYNPNNGDFEKYNKQRGNKVKDGKEVIDKDYENYLAVPPPPPGILLNQDKIHYDNNKPYNKKPIVHTKPVQDMKVFLNIQHPVPNSNPQQQLPKVTSEIYFAAQAPNSHHTPTYTLHIPHAPPSRDSYLNRPLTTTNQLIKSPDANAGQTLNTYSVASAPTTSNKSIATNNVNNKDNTYTVTLNTATNVASNVGEGQVIGSSVPVDVVPSNSNEALNTNIPIGTNFAITVDDGSSSFENYNMHENQNPALVYEVHSHKLVEETVTGDNRWNKSSADQPATIEFNTKATNDQNIDYYKSNKYKTKPAYKEIRPSSTPSVNSHANFPMMNEHTTIGNEYDNVKQIKEYQEDNKTVEQKRPAKVIPNIPTNSHGWYSSVIMNENNINNIKVDSTTRKVIPLTNDYNSDSLPDFGQKITSVGKPPTDYWTHNRPVSNSNVGKPFTRPSTESSVFKVTPEPTTLYSSPNYLPHNFDTMKQPAYDIPIRDNSDETTTTKVKPTTEKLKPVYETSDEIYDGEEEEENSGEIDGEVSSESMKVPVVSSSNEIDDNKKSSPNTSLLQEEVFNSPSYTQKQKDGMYDFNPGTQTEKPFNNKTNTSFQSNTIRPIYENDSHLKPRPFTINAMTSLDHQLQQPHWQINQLMENATNISYEDNIDLNMGEEMISTKKPSTQEVSYHQTQSEIKYKRPPRPQFIRPINSHTVNDTNIITSTVHIKDKKPLIVEKPNDKSTLPTFTIPATLELNRTSSEIIDLSPPPPTMDYSFRPSTNDEMIMGMSPPPPRTPPAIRVPSRISSTPRPVSPVRTPPPYINKPRRTLPPRLPTQKPLRKPSNRDDVSTYRPAFDMNNIRRPAYNDQPSSQLLPPPRNIPSRVVNPINELPSPTVSASSVPNLVFPTPISTGWLTSSGIDFSSSFNFGPTSIQFPKNPISSRVPDLSEVDTVSDNSYSYETEPSSSERVPDVSSERPITNNRVSTPKDSIINTESSTPLQDSSPEENISDSLPNESSQEETSTEKTRGPQGFKNRPRKPYPLRHDDKKSTPTKYRIPSKPTSIIRPTRTLSRPEILYPTRHTSIRKIVRPIPTKTTTISSSIIESSESSIDDEFIHPTEVMKDTLSSSSRIDKNDFSSVSLQSQSSVATPILSDSILNVRPTHHSGNEVKISDEAIPTKTEFKTTVITLTKTLSEPPKTVSSIGYVNLTHTLTVTHTKTSLVSLSEGAVTQTLVLTNTHTSTLVDIITKVQTQVQPTTIIETVTKHIPIPVEPTPVQEVNPNTNVPLDDISMSSEENENLIIKDKDTKPVQKIETEGEGDNDTFFVVMNKSQNGGPAPPVTGDIETGDYDGVTRNEQVNSNGVSQVLFGEILLAGTPYLETTNVVNPGVTYGKECQPDCKASRNERCQRIDGLMKCVCRPGFARMFPDRPCKPTYTYSVKLALGSQGKERLHFHQNLSDNSSKEYHTLAIATHEGINRMVMQSDLRDVFHGVHITGFSPVQMKDENGDDYQGVMNDFYVQLSDNAHESRLKEVIEKYLRNNNYSLGGTEVHAAGELVDRLDVSDFDECTSGQFHDCSEHAQCFNLRGTYTCSCLEGFADLSVNTLYPGRICSAEPVGCERCNYHGACYSRDDRRVLCECFQWYAGGSCQINLKVVLISLVVAGAVLSVILAICAVVACSKKPRPEPRSIVACIQSMPSLHQGAMPSKQRADRRALISERGESGDTNSMQNASLPYMPAKKHSSNKKGVMSDPPAHDPPPPPAPAVMIPRARLHHDSRENIARKRSLELSSEAKLISYLESGTVIPNDEMRRKHSMESSYSANKDRHNKQGALVSAGFKVSTTIRPDENAMKDQRDDLSSVHKADLEAELSRYDTMRKSYSQEDLSEWTDAERRIGELTLSEARSVGGTLPASTGRAASSTRLTHQEANTMAERDLGSTFLLPHVHLYKPDLTSDVSEFDSL